MALVALLLAAPPAAAFEAFDGRLQAHGFYESQLRMLSADYSEQWDLAQWYQVFNVELEAELLQDTVGILDMVSAYVRIEGRYDCVYSQGCGMFNSVNSFGNDARSLPPRLRGARERTFMGVIAVPRTSDELLVGTSPADAISVLVDDVVDFDLRSEGSKNPVGLNRVAGFSVLAGSAGADGFIGDATNDTQCLLTHDPSICAQLAGGSGNAAILNNDDPFRYIFENQSDFRFTQIQAIGGERNGLPTKVLGPWLPKNKVRSIGALADRVNPFDPDDQSPILRAAVFNTELTGGGIPANEGNFNGSLAVADASRGAGANPFKPVPLDNPGPGGRGVTTARGMFYPSAPLRRVLGSGQLNSFNFNFSETERAFNRGDSQQDEGELKEAYLDIEMFDSRLWMRIGKQTIVWGKTELFRTTDQFNPQDLALASLPSLEESRIALWGARGVWSFYEVGPLEDVRFEIALNFDEYQSADLGACGEAFTPNVVCQLTFGAFAHGTAGVGIVGVDRPPAPWNDLKGLEAGVRLEFRWDRFSFAITDFYGYSDFPTLDRISTFERNVDPATGRPRIIGARGPCTTGDAILEPACLTPGPTSRRDSPNFNVPDNQFNTPSQRAGAPGNALDYHHANVQIFTMICATTIGFSALDPTACAQTVFGSTARPAPTLGLFSIGQLISAVVAGSDFANQALASTLPASVNLPLVALSKDPNDLSNGGTNCRDRTQTPIGLAPECGGLGSGSTFAIVDQELASRLTPEQEALLGCGPFWGNNCDDAGMDLLNMEASAIFQSFIGVEGTSIGWRTDDASRPQPGTVGFVGGPVCSFGNLLANPNSAVVGPRLPGCRGPGDAGYSVAVDGNPSGTSTNLVQVAGPIDADSGLPVLVPSGSAGVHPFTGQPWQNEMAAASWNFLMLLVTQSEQFSVQMEETLRDGGDVVARAYSVAPGECSFRQPQFCDTPQSLNSVIGVQRNIVQAGGNGAFGRRTFVWHSGGEAVITYDKRNVLGFSMDFAEDVTKTNWGIESTWIESVPLSNNNRVSGISRVQEFNFTISVDRPTFISFLNPNRTFFITSQWFFRYQSGFEDGITSNGPWNVLGLLLINTGYYQDRLLPSLIFVWDFQSRSGAALPSVTYRYNEAFSVTVGAAIFNGREQHRPTPVNQLGTSSVTELGPLANRTSVENGLSVVRDRDELFLKIRYTF